MVRSAFRLAAVSALSALALTVGVVPAHAACNPGFPNAVDNYEIVVMSTTHGVQPTSGVVTIYNPLGATATVWIWDDNFNLTTLGSCDEDHLWSGLTDPCVETLLIPPNQVMDHFFTIPPAATVKFLWVRVTGPAGRGIATVSVDLTRGVIGNEEVYDHSEIERRECK